MVQIFAWYFVGHTNLLRAESKVQPNTEPRSLFTLTHDGYERL